MTSRQRTRAAVNRRYAPWLAALFALWAIVNASGCARSRARTQDEVLGPDRAQVVVVRLGPLVSEHPLYSHVAELTSFLSGAETADLKAAKAFLTSPLGRALAPPRLPEGRPDALTRWEAAADVELAAELEEAGELLASWPRPELSKTRRRLTAEAEDESRRRRNRALMEAVRAEMRAIEERAGLLAELRQLAASRNQTEAARAVERQVELWREIAAEADAARRQADTGLEDLKRAHRQRLAEAVAALETAADTDRERHLAQLSDGGTAVRQAQLAATEAASAAVPPAATATNTPPAPETAAIGELIAEIERAHQAAWERRRSRLAAARSRLLKSIAADTRGAVRAIAATNGIEVQFAWAEDADLPDATDGFRVLLRNHWAAQPAARSHEVALTTQ